MPLPKVLRHLPLTAPLAIALLILLISSDFYASQFWLDHPAITATLASLSVVLVSVTVIEVILSRRSERRWRLLAQYALLELAEAARGAWVVLLGVVAHRDSPRGRNLGARPPRSPTRLVGQENGRAGSSGPRRDPVTTQGQRAGVRPSLTPVNGTTAQEAVIRLG
jgi:hypothetical protein